MTAECVDCADRPATVEEARARGYDPNATQYRPRTPRELHRAACGARGITSSQCGGRHDDQPEQGQG